MYAYALIIIEHLYDNAIRAVQVNSSIVEWLRILLELGKDAFSHPSSTTFFSKGLCLMLWMNMMERGPRSIAW